MNIKDLVGVTSRGLYARLAEIESERQRITNILSIFSSHDANNLMLFEAHIPASQPKHTPVKVLGHILWEIQSRAIYNWNEKNGNGCPIVEVFFRSSKYLLALAPEDIVLLMKKQSPNMDASESHFHIDERAKDRVFLLNDNLPGHHADSFSVDFTKDTYMKK
jgi:hypothetical protein